MTAAANLSTSTSELYASELRRVDRDLMRVLRKSGLVSVEQLIEELGVTATAVRQRIQRLLDLGLIEREKIVAGRGRPTYRYQLTVSGHRHAGANASDLADAMWREILLLPDSQVRQELISSIASRLGRQFAAQLDGTAEDDSFESRMRELSSMLTDRQMSSEVSRIGNLPVLDISSCPYPTLTDTSEDRVMCRLEEQMFSEALGQPVELSSCRLDGDACCQFSLIPSSTATGTPASTISEK
jgi:predicted ArsR family transcriptional regulator